MDKHNMTLLSSYGGAVHHENESTTAMWKPRKVFLYYERKKQKAKENSLDSYFHLYKIPKQENRLPGRSGEGYPIPKKVQNTLGF